VELAMIRMINCTAPSEPSNCSNLGPQMELPPVLHGQFVQPEHLPNLAELVRSGVVSAQPHEVAVFAMLEGLGTSGGPACRRCPSRQAAQPTIKILLRMLDG